MTGKSLWERMPVVGDYRQASDELAALSATLPTPPPPFLSASLVLLDEEQDGAVPYLMLAHEESEFTVEIWPPDMCSVSLWLIVLAKAHDRFASGPGWQRHMLLCAEQPPVPFSNAILSCTCSDDFMTLTIYTDGFPDPPRPELRFRSKDARVLGRYLGELDGWISRHVANPNTKGQA